MMKSDGCARTSRWSIALVVPLTLLWACAGSRSGPVAAAGVEGAAGGASVAPDSTGGVALNTDQSRYRAGARVILSLVNRTRFSYAFNPCTRVLEREVDGAWQAVQEPARVCTMEASVVAPGAGRGAATDLPATLVAGRYRLVIALTREGGAVPAERLQAVSAPIVVGP